MIPGTVAWPVARYWYIDHCAEGAGYTKPADGEEFVGIPYGYYARRSPPCIEVYKGGNLIRTINALDLREIEFVVKQNAPCIHDPETCGWDGLGTCPVCGEEVGRITPETNTRKT